MYSYFFFLSEIPVGIILSSQQLFKIVKYMYFYHTFLLLEGSIIFEVVLTHLCIVSHKRAIGKRCRPKSDAAEHGVWSGSSLFALGTGISIKHNNNKQNKKKTVLLLEMDLSKELRQQSPIGINRSKCFCTSSVLNWSTEMLTSIRHLHQSYFFYCKKSWFDFIKQDSKGNDLVETMKLI